MSEYDVSEAGPDGVDSPADRPIRDIDPKASLDGVSVGIDRPEQEGSVKDDALLNASLIPYFGSIENYKRLKRMYPLGIPASAIATGC